MQKATASKPNFVFIFSVLIVIKNMMQITVDIYIHMLHN